MEKLKESLNKEQADCETEKSALRKRAEDAEAALKPVVDELTGVKRQIHAILLLCSVSTLSLYFQHIFPCVAGLLTFVTMQELALVIWALMYRRS